MIVHGLLNIVLSTGKNRGNMSLECEWTFNSCGNLAMGCYNCQVMCHIWESIVWNNRKRLTFFPQNNSVDIFWKYFNYTNWWYMFYIDTKHFMYENCWKISAWILTADLFIRIFWHHVASIVDRLSVLWSSQGLNFIWSMLENPIIKSNEVLMV